MSAERDKSLMMMNHKEKEDDEEANRVRGTKRVGRVEGGEEAKGGTKVDRKWRMAKLVRFAVGVVCSCIRRSGTGVVSLITDCISTSL